jgi:hypothetical protein
MCLFKVIFKPSAACFSFKQKVFPEIAPRNIDFDCRNLWKSFPHTGEFIPYERLPQLPCAPQHHM